MFNRKTLFIIGAGAGFDVDLPVGRKLAEDIAGRTTITLDHGRLGRETVDEDLALCFFERNDPKANEYARAFNLIRNGVLLSNSIDDFLNVHEGSPEVVTVGKAAIVRSILYAERHSKLYVDPSNIYNKLDVTRIRDSWLVKFMQVLTPGRKVPHVERTFDDISFINFNYDRCLEHFLIHALGGNIHGRLDYRELSKQIKTYTEQVEEESTVFSMQEAIRDADCIVFLGFAYHKQNMKLLFEPPPMRTKTKPVFGTALNMSDADVQEVSAELLNLFPEIDENEDEPDDGGLLDLATPRLRMQLNDHMHIENKLDCSRLFDHYAKSLAG